MAQLSRWIAALAVLLPFVTLVLADISAGDYYVHRLPGAPEGDELVKMHAGHIEITPEHNRNMFFWHFQNKHIADKQRTVIWLNGGPGCSSEDGAMMEIGPYRLKDADTLEYNNGSWHEFANLLFVDNPVGTGYSYVDTDSYVDELDIMADQFLIFLEKWFHLFPEYEHDELYIAGESFAGQHIPYIAKAILDRNKKPDVETKWNLQGLLIGNGWVAPNEQYEAYLAFAYAKGLVQKGSEVAGQLETQLRICRKDLALTGSPKVQVPSCEEILGSMLRWTQKKIAGGKTECFNIYDVRLTDAYPQCGMNWPPDLAYVTPYLRKPEVVAALHVSPKKNTGWVECNTEIGLAFNVRKSRPAVDLLPDILREVRVLLFSGAEDLICNHMGTEAFISKMEWNGGKGFELSPGNWAPRRDWVSEGEPAGFWQEARNLTYVLFYNSSHMVPFDHPRRTREMLDRFTGVNVSSIGGVPSQSSLDGERLPETTVGGMSNQTETDHAAKEEELKAAKWAAYQKSGEVVLAIVAIGAAIWGLIVWRSRNRTSGYMGLPPAGHRESNLAMDRFRTRRTRLDVEAADFDENQLDDLHVAPSTDMHRRDHSIGAGSDDDSLPEKRGSGAKNASRS
ncbi:alpha/beta-hydrolase [Poronia punctata]|nr:alpha/beta-hydrolase [Poronia punctata]